MLSTHLRPHQVVITFCVYWQ